MRPFKPDGRIDLEHRAYFLRGSTESSVVVAASEDGHVYLVELASNSARLQRPTTNLRAIFPHPTEPLFAYVDGKSGLLIVQSFVGKRVAEVEPPCIATDASISIKQGFADCYFDEDGD